jgi:hypothetical protein
MKRIILLQITFIFTLNVLGQKPKSDSMQVVQTLQELLLICKTVDFNDPNEKKLGPFYKASNFIIYRGENKNRAWKDYANYKNSNEKKEVDAVCERINNSVNQDPNYKIIKFFTKRESEGKWYIVEVLYFKQEQSKKAVFAFLKVKGHYGLGDID